LKDIEKLKKANDFLKTLFASIENYKHEEGTSYPVGVPNFNYRDEFQINYNEMCIEIMEYFVEKLGDKEELQLGKYLTCWMDMCESRIRIGIGFSLNDELESKLYDEVFGSHSTIYVWTKNNLLPLLSLVANKYLDFKDTIDFFEYVGTESDGDTRRLAWNASTYTKGADSAKKIIDKIFELAEDEEVLKDIDEVLDVYFDKVFKYNKED
jgi:hypothetical protein